MNPSDSTLHALFPKIRSIAVVGASDSPSKPVDHVGRYLIKAGFTIYPVHPVRKDVWGLPTFASLADLPAPVDLVDLFRAAEYCPGHAREVLALRAKPFVFWMQQGITSPEATRLMEDAGVIVVQDACLMVEHKRIMRAA